MFYMLLSSLTETGGAPAAPIVTFAIGPRRALLQQPREVREANIAAIPDPVERATRRSVIEHGVRAPEFAGALRVFLDTLDRMESELGEGPWLSGPIFGLADASLLPYVLRLEHLALDPVLAASERPRVADWLARVKTLPSYATAVDAWIVPAAVEMMRANGKGRICRTSGVAANATAETTAVRGSL